MTSLQTLATPAWEKAVTDILRRFSSLLTLAHSPLAHNSLIGPALVLDEMAPTAEERGTALRQVLFWAVGRLAPGQVRHPFGAERPLTDPTWRDPPWWSYNILRHRYLEPLHPDQFVEDGRYTETLMQIMGIPDENAFYAERNQGIRLVAAALKSQLHDNIGSAEIRQEALAKITGMIAQHPDAAAVVGIASAFRSVFPSAWLEELIAAERLPDGKRGLSWLIQNNILRSSSDATELWLSTILRQAVYNDYSQQRVQRCHGRIAHYYQRDGDGAEAIWHYYQGQAAKKAVDLALEWTTQSEKDVRPTLRRDILQQFTIEDTTVDKWLLIQCLLIDALFALGDIDQAERVCRQAVSHATANAESGRLYRRLGKLYEVRNPQLALEYYQRAEESLSSDAQEYAVLLKDRGWLHVLRREYTAAERDLEMALAQTNHIETTNGQKVLDALSVLRSSQKRYDEAIALGRQALNVSETLGDTAGMARALHNMGHNLNAQGKHTQAIAVFTQANQLFKQLHDRRALATGLLNVGVSYHLENQLGLAVTHYQDSLALCRQIGLPHIEVKLHGNLAEALAQLNHAQAAQHHWRSGMALAYQHGFEDQVVYFRALTGQFEPLATLQLDVALPEKPDAPPRVELDATEQLALQIARQTGQVTARVLMEKAHVSKSTATRRLTTLVTEGYLERKGQKRGVHYILPVAAPGGILRRCQRLFPALKAEYGVTNMGTFKEPGQRPTLVVQFDTLPDLLTFFSMREKLQNALATPVEIIPADAVSVQPRAEWLIAVS